MLVTHHPLIFRPLRSVDVNDPLGKSIQMAVEHRLAVFAAHTNLDRTPGGLNDLLAERIGLKHVAPPRGEEDRAAWGRIGDLPRRTALASLARRLKKAFGVRMVRIAGPPQLAATRVFVCSGSGGGLVGEFLRSDAQVYISGDLRYHDALQIAQAGRGLIDIGHFASERIVVDALQARLSAALRDIGARVAVVAYPGETDPFDWV